MYAKRKFSIIIFVAFLHLLCEEFFAIGLRIYIAYVFILPSDAVSGFAGLNCACGGVVTRWGGDKVGWWLGGMVTRWGGD